MTRDGMGMVRPQEMLAGRYRIGEVLARGGMGIVYRGEDERLGRPVAVKTVHTSSADLIERLRREAAHLARLNHPNIVRLYDVVDHGGQPHLVTQFVEGRPLRELLGGVSPARTAWIGEEIASALSAAHELGIVHRDLKPSNVLVDDDDTVHLLDFGIARHVDDATVTAPGSLVGTASYISPEQLQGRPAQPPADIYALGLVLIECLTGRAAYPGTFAETVAARIVSPPDLTDVPPAWHGLLARMTALDPAARPSAAGIGGALRELRRQASSTAPTVRRSEPLATAGFAVATVASAPAARPARRRSRRNVRSRAVVPVAVAAGFLGVVGAATTVTGGAPDPVGSTEIAAAVPTTQAPTVPPTTVPPTTEPPTTTTTARAVPPPTPPTAPPTTAAPAPVPVPVAVTATTLDARTVRELQRLKQAQDLQAFQRDWEERVEAYTKRGKRGRDRD